MRLLARKIWQHVYGMYGVRQNVEVGKNFHMGIGSILWAPEQLVVADNVYIGKFCTIECDGRIGNNVMVANNVGFVGRYDHDFRCVGKEIRNAPWIGSHDYTGPGKGLQVIVEDDVWIGFGSVLLTGVTIGRGAIVAAGCVVTKNVEPYTIVGGNPARRLAERFSITEINRHEQLLGIR
jgi:acetyltransferase-like isoleucine patch superfamily enzyme